MLDWEGSSWKNRTLMTYPRILSLKHEATGSDQPLGCMLGAGLARV